MAYFAELDSDNKVIRTVAVNNEVITDGNGDEQESLGVTFLRNLYNDQTAVWKQTSYNTRSGKYYDPGTNSLGSDQTKAFRKNYAVPGMEYDSNADAFVESDDIKPYSDWTLNSTTGRWEAPVAEPSSWTHNGEASDQEGYSVSEGRFMGHFPDAEDSDTKAWFSYNNSSNSWELMYPQLIPPS